MTKLAKEWEVKSHERALKSETGWTSLAKVFITDNRECSCLEFTVVSVRV